ncbi:unnamed protein product [Diamesa serratosioi]
MESSSVVSLSSNDQLLIVLHIEEGISLNLSSNSNDVIILQATLGGIRLDSEPIKPGHTTSFDCNLIWETDRKSIKRMKQENHPLKLECFVLKQFNGNLETAVRDKIGYILVPVRNITILPLAKAVEMKSRWSKVIGLSKEYRQMKPELLMSAMITDREFITHDRTTRQESQGLESQDSVIINVYPMIQSQQGIFIRLLEEEGLLQVGNIDTNCDIFLIQILLKNVRFMENMLNDEESSQNSSKVYHLNYELLGKSYNCVLSKKFNRTFSINEKIAISFRSTLKTLQEYFEKVFFIPIDLVCDNVVVGTAVVKLDNLIKFTKLTEFITNYSSSDSSHQNDTNFMIKPTKHVDATDNKPHIEVRLVIKYLGTKKLHQTELLENYQKGTDFCGGGDFQNTPSEFPPTSLPPKKANNRQEKVKSISEVSINKATSSNVDELKKAKQTMSDPSIPCKLDRTSSHTQKADIDLILSSNNAGKITNLPRLFSYNLQMKSIKLNRKPEKGIWQLSFFHDKADTPRTFFNKEIKSVDDCDENLIAFEDIELKLFFTSHADNIMELIKSSEICTLCIKGPHGTHAKAHLDCSSLLIGNKENASGLILLKNQQNDITAMANIFVYLDDLGINFNMQLKSTESQVMVTPSEYRNEANVETEAERQLLDESLAYKMIEELEEWKICQRDKFMDELKQKEQSYLSKLKTAWDESRSKQEQVLLDKLDKYKSMTSALDAAQKCLKLRGNQYCEDEKEINKVKLELEQSYNAQLLAIRERARRLEDDMIYELKLKDLKFADVERVKQRLEVENNDLKTSITNLQSELQEVQRNMIPKQELEHLVQDMRMLNDKFETTLQSKLFYKEQWAKALRESHKIKIESIQRTKENILDSKCSRIIDFLSQENCNLDFEQTELDEIKSCLQNFDSNDDH